MEDGEHFRLFVALLLPDEAIARLVEWQALELPERPGMRVVPPENLHVTLAFLGSRPAVELDSITEAVRASAAGREPPVFEPARYRETRSVGMIVLDDEQGAIDDEHDPKTRGPWFRRLDATSYLLFGIVRGRGQNMGEGGGGP